jgi:hypothetical protein
MLYKAFSIWFEKAFFIGNTEGGYKFQKKEFNILNEKTDKAIRSYFVLTKLIVVQKMFVTWFNYFAKSSPFSTTNNLIND